VGRLVVQLVAELQKKGLGVRRTDLIVEKVDGTRQAIRAGTAKPARDVAWLTKLFKDRTEKIEPGFGIEKLTLVAVMSEVLDETQRSSSLVEEEVIDLTPLIDIYGNRGQRVYRVAPVASDVPERSVQRIGAVSDPVEAAWVNHWKRPVRLLARPEQVDVMALMPDHPPAWIMWRGKRRKVKNADGPERIFGEWWARNSEMAAVRDYFVIEDDTGERLGFSVLATASIPKPGTIGGSCTGYSADEIRRTPGHDAFLLSARGEFGAGTVPDRQVAGDRCYRRRRSEFACRHRPCARGVSCDWRSAWSSAAVSICRTGCRSWSIRRIAPPIPG
jgi:hypothetical protein